MQDYKSKLTSDKVISGLMADVVGQRHREATLRLWDASRYCYHGTPLSENCGECENEALCNIPGNSRD